MLGSHNLVMITGIWLGKVKSQQLPGAIIEMITGSCYLLAWLVAYASRCADKD